MPSTATSILDGLSTSVAVKSPCRTVATTNITLSGLQTINGYTTVENDRVLVVGQTNAVDNGIYMASSGSWTRSKDADGARDLVQGTRVLIAVGASGVEYELTTANPIVIGTTALTFVRRYGANAFYDQTVDEALAGFVPTNYGFPDGNIERTGLNQYGSSDVSAEFNDIGFATYAAWVPTTRPRTINVTAGKYRLDETVYVRSGCAVIGSGMGTYIDASNFGAVADNVFQLGWGNIAGTPTMDSGGYPPEISNMFFNGGPSGGGACVHQSFPGGLIHDLWCAAAGLGVYLAGGYLYDCEFDLGLTGVKIGPSTNQTVSNCRFFNPNFCIEFDVASTDIADCIIDGCTFEYPKFAAISIGTGTGRVRGLKVSNCIFTNNADYTTYIALIYLVNANCIVEFNNCTFRNWKNYAAVIQTSGGVVDFIGCIFDGEPSHSTYTPESTTSAGIDFSLGTLRIKNCVARHLDGVFLNFGGTSAAHVEIDGLSFEDVDGATVVNITNSNAASTFKAKNITGDGLTEFINAQATVPISIKSSTGWFGAVANASSRDYVLVPYQASSLYQITLTANQNAGGSGAYRKSSLVYAQKDNDFSGTARSYINQVTAIEGAAHTNPVLDIDVEFGAVGGTAEIASSNSGSIAISWPDSYSIASLDVQLIQSG